MNQYVKIVVTVPKVDAGALRKVIGQSGAGQIGNYSYCSFSITGTGRFTPNDNANPAIGKANKLEEVSEERVEVTCQRCEAKRVVASIRKAHPYEEPVIDIYALLDEENL